MNGEVFYWVMNMSIAGTVIGLIVLLLRKLPRLSRRLTVWLWCIPLVRLLLPVGVESKYSLMNLIRQLTETPVIYPVDTWIDFEASMMNMIGVADSYFPIVYPTETARILFSAAELIWMTVALAGVFAAVVMYVLTASELRTAEYVGNGVYRSDKVTSPMVFGVFRPKIVLSGACGSNGEVSEYVLLHEQVHIRRKDNLWRIFAVITACVHWFNPFIWLFLKRFLSDQELACDEKVISLCGEGRRKEYAAALLDWEEQRTVFASAFGGAKIRVRVEKILSYRRLTIFSTVGFLVLATIIAVAFLTNAVG